MLGKTPPVVKNLIIINVLMLIATFTFHQFAGTDLVKVLGMYHFSSPNFEPYQVITHMFMHGGLWHLFFNMFALWMFGRVLESVWGGKRFFIYYMVTAFGAAAIYLIYLSFTYSQMEDLIMSFQNNPSPELFAAFVNDYIPLDNLNREYVIEVKNVIGAWKKNPDTTVYVDQAMHLMQEFINFKRNIPMVGASGAVFGVLLAFGMLFPNTELMLLFPPIPIKAKYFVIIYGAIELFMGVRNNPTDNVAHFAHLGGMLFGFILIKYWNKNSQQFY